MLVPQIPSGLFLLFLLLLLLGCAAAPPPVRPCGDHEERACLLCHEPTCLYPFVNEPLCRFINVCHLGCGCSFGYLRDDDTNRCVPSHQCAASSIPYRVMHFPRKRM